jgi:hypothetical protein
MLLTTPGKRYAMDQIRAELNIILENSSKDQYCQQGFPRLDRGDNARPSKRFRNKPQGNVDIDLSPGSFSDHVLTFNEDITQLENLVSDDPPAKTDIEEDIQTGSENRVEMLPSQHYATGRATSTSLKASNRTFHGKLQRLWRKLRRVARRPQF